VLYYPGKLVVFKKEIMLKSYLCVVCGYVYDEEKGAPDEGLAPGTKWEDVPDSWICPECGVMKDDFEMVQV
jgi:rubredoxin